MKIRWLNELRSSKQLVVESVEFVELVVCQVYSVRWNPSVNFVKSSRCFAGRSSLSSWFAWWGSYCLTVCKDCWSIFCWVRLVVFVESCRGLEHFVCQWVQFVEYVELCGSYCLRESKHYWVCLFGKGVALSCIKVWSFSLPQRVTINRLCRVGRIVGSYCL